MGFASGLLQALLWVGGFVGVCAAILRAFFVSVYTVEDNGMAPNMVYGDKVLVWRKAAPDFGNIMVCEHPSDGDTIVVGRVLAFAGHSVGSDRLGNIYVDSNRASVEQLGVKIFYDVTQNRQATMQASEIAFGTQPSHIVFREKDSPLEFPTYQVNQGMFLLGDNLSDITHDSRTFGEVDPNSCKGQVFMRLRPAPSNDDDIDHGYLDIID